MIRLIGIAMIALSFCYGGILVSDRIRQSQKKKKALMELLYHIQVNIAHGPVPLQDIFFSFSNEPLEQCGFLPLLRKNGPNALTEALRQCRSLGLTAEERELYGTFAERLGKSGFPESESELCLRTIEEAKHIAEKNAEKEIQRADLYRRLGPVCGLFVAALLL